jgi:hypothetical protein
MTVLSTRPMAKKQKESIDTTQIFVPRWKNYSEYPHWSVLPPPYFRRSSLVKRMWLWLTTWFTNWLWGCVIIGLFAFLWPRRDRRFLRVAAMAAGIGAWLRYRHERNKKVDRVIYL